MEEHLALWRSMSDDCGRHRLAVIDAASHVTDINMPGYRLHPLAGDRDGIWAISVSGNWRITFEFVNGDAYILDYEDYH